MRVTLFAFVFLFLFSAGISGQQTSTKAAREKLQAFHDLIGVWNGTGTPVGSREEVQRNFWTEKMDWGWQFKGSDAWIKIDFEKSKNFTAGELRFVPEKEHFTLTLTTPAKEKLTYVGTLANKVFTLERETDKEAHRLIFTFLHANRFLYRYEVRAEGRALFAKKWTVGATKEGEAFAVGSGASECVVSGGRGTSAVTHLGKTYYVCCSGCRDEFVASPARYVKEYEEKLKAKKK
ncbi:MAG: hypothetical protein EXS16_10965 [Gemmataceae bacterium]|nr:hypothetical protein [Gemmataceae bacterium]